MRLLCDEPVAASYEEAIANRPWCTAAVSALDTLGEGAPDVRLCQYAVEHEYVLLTADADFFQLDPDCGVLYYHPQSALLAGEVADAIGQIVSVYPSEEYPTIRESLPEWV